MKSFDYVITDPVGIHARPAGVIVNAAKGFPCKVTVEKPGKAPADAKRIFGLMGLGIKCGEKVTVRCDGEGEEDAIEQLEKIFKENL